MSCLPGVCSQIKNLIPKYTPLINEKKLLNGGHKEVCPSWTWGIDFPGEQATLPADA